MRPWSILRRCLSTMDSSLYLKIPIKVDDNEFYDWKQIWGIIFWCELFSWYGCQPTLSKGLIWCSPWARKKMNLWGSCFGEKWTWIGQISSYHQQDERILQKDLSVNCHFYSLTENFALLFHLLCALSKFVWSRCLYLLVFVFSGEAIYS